MRSAEPCWVVIADFSRRNVAYEPKPLDSFAAASTGFLDKNKTLDQLRGMSPSYKTAILNFEGNIAWDKAEQAQQALDQKENANLIDFNLLWLRAGRQAGQGSRLGLQLDEDGVDDNDRESSY